MSCKQISDFLDAYIDKELDLVTSAQFDRHLAECDGCRAMYDGYLQMRDFIKARMEYFHAPDAFKQKFRAHLYPARRPQALAARPEWAPRWSQWTLAVAVLTVLLFAALLFQLARRPSSSDLLAQEVVSSHIRSLLANHLSDVISTDQHTVKPWFSGKLDFAPVVEDLSSKGFPLVGGRLDYLNNRTVAALVYRRRQHTINLFEWPSSSAGLDPRSLNLRGYNVVYWTRAHMEYWAVSDVNAGDLREFAREVEQ